MPYDPITISIALFFLLVFLVVLASFASICYLRRVDLGPILHKIATLKGDVASLQNTKSDLSAELKALKNEAAVAEQIIARAKAEQDWLDQNRDTIAAKREQIATINENLKDMNKKKETLNGELQVLRQEQQRLAGENQANSTTNARLKNENNVLQSQIQSLETRKAAAESENAHAQQKLLETHTDITQANAILAGKEREISKAEQYINDIKETKKRLEEEIQQLKKDKLELDSKNGKLQGEIEVREGRLSAHKEDDERKWDDLDTPLAGYPYENIKRRKLMDEIAWIEEFKNQLKDSKIKFDPRTIRAFHTSLKVSDYSPLVVLAGISGTGKSLLPRLYAMAMGMNFMQIAVQPRWDNPQDMFGFYNYMEGRYKATELSRLLWQYDINNKKAQDLLNGMSPMNLVLLDEMNIAKVEYYFSDMLSKLEVRRDVNESDENSRANAEIELECGSIKEKENARRLFVGKNTLFVGTMNEDESTQSLSDKVIDRSNVLRFGKPKDIKASPDVANFNIHYTTDPYDPSAVIDYETWKQWMRTGPLGQTHIETLQDINEQLEKLGRPFAYRVANAIQAYIINYPDQSSSGIQDAMADQIEMKILPKLNGIDKDSANNKRALDAIGNIIDTIGDEALSIAFKEAKDDSDHVFFQWRGIAR